MRLLVQARLRTPLPLALTLRCAGQSPCLHTGWTRSTLDQLNTHSLSHSSSPARSHACTAPLAHLGLRRSLARQLVGSLHPRSSLPLDPDPASYFILPAPDLTAPASHAASIRDARPPTRPPRHRPPRPLGLTNPHRLRSRLYHTARCSSIRSKVSREGFLAHSSGREESRGGCPCATDERRVLCAYV